MIRYHNLSLREMVQRLFTHELLDAKAWVNGSIAVRRDRDGSEKLILAHYSANGVTPFEKVAHSYDELYLAKQSISLSDLLLRFERAAETGSLEWGDGLTTEISAPATIELLPSDSPALGHGAKYLIQVPAKTREHLFPSPPIMRYGQLSFESLEQAVRFWIPLQLQSQSDARFGHVIVEVPLAAPRFGVLSVPDDTLMQADVQGVRENTIPELTGVWQSGDGRQVVPFAQKVTAPRINLRRPPWATRVALWLTLPDSLVTDFYFEDEVRCSRTHRVLFPSGGGGGSAEDSAITQIHGGENEHVEFKPFIKPGPGKFDELIRTVIAFANKRGGTVYLGVSDHQDIIGIEKGLKEWVPKEASSSPEDCVRHYCASVRESIGRRVMGKIDIEIQPMQLANVKVVVVRVAEGKEKPYADVQTKDIWTRRGATTTKPDPAELKQLVNVGYRVKNPFDLS